MSRIIVTEKITCQDWSNRRVYEVKCARSQSQVISKADDTFRSGCLRVSKGYTDLSSKLWQNNLITTDQVIEQQNVIF